MCNSGRELRVALKVLPGFSGKRGLPIKGFDERFCAAGSLSTLQPPPIQGLVDQIQAVRRNGRFFLLASGVTDAYKKSGQQQGNPEHCAARVSGQDTRARWIQ